MYTIKDLTDIKMTLEALDKRYGRDVMGHDAPLNFGVWIVQVDSELWRSELSEKYGINVPASHVYHLQRHYLNINQFMSIAEYGPKCGRDISCPDDDRQPDDGHMLRIELSGGPYIFGNNSFTKEDYDYPVEFFNQFIAEILSFNPDYKDSKNRSYYWKLENASDVFNAFPALLEKYNHLNAEGRLKRQVRRFEALAEEAKAKLKESTGTL